MIRNRSISRSRVVKINHEEGGKEFLDPIALLEELTPHIKDFDIPLHVKIQDNENFAIYLLSNFVIKEYEVIGDSVKFGFKRIKLREMKVTISYDLEISSE